MFKNNKTCSKTTGVCVGIHFDVGRSSRSWFLDRWIRCGGCHFHCPCSPLFAFPLHSSTLAFSHLIKFFVSEPVARVVFDVFAISQDDSFLIRVVPFLVVVVTTSSASPVISIRISILLTSSSSSSMLGSSVHLCDASPINVCTLRPLWIKFSDLVAINCHGRVICHLHWYVCERCTNTFSCHF